MNGEIILKDEEKEYLLQRAPEGSPARAILTGARPDHNQPTLVIFTCDEQAAYSLLEVAVHHCGCAWRVMHYQMSRLGLLKH